ncbi:Tetratricopeptide repeat protein 8 [Trichinella spiralis]|uniref:Tetratricopeptide repeat protein 8 n=1 Tax=Trichinella spiralis TaxID=6334 RepID=A0A0V1C406_TRISP|nr:Tetratricopeptide repeat protein 8 [Trichinella spiralis]
MDPLYVALHYFRFRKFDQSIDECTRILQENPRDQAAWLLKLNCIVCRTRIDDTEFEETGLAEELMNEEVLANMPRPATSLRKPQSASGNGQGSRPTTKSGRPVTGILRPGSQIGRNDTFESVLRTGRTANSSRPITSMTGRFVRLGTASMIANKDGTFINVSRLNLSKYANQSQFARPLFEYLLFSLNDVRLAFQLASMATEASEFKDCYWKIQIARCYMRIGLNREAEKQLKSAYALQPSVTTGLLLSKVYCAIDQPLKAIESLRQTLTQFPDEISLLKALGRIYENLNDFHQSEICFKQVLKRESVDVESIACLATHYFYNDRPELAQRFFRRLLQMGVMTTETLLNIGLCCFNAQQFDLAIDCLQQAITLAEDEQAADVWYNVGKIALATGDIYWARQCYSLCLAYSSDYAEAWCDLGVLEMHENNTDQLGEYGSSLNAVKRALEINPEHVPSKELNKRLFNLLPKMNQTTRSTIKSVILKKGPSGFGFNIAGGKDKSYFPGEFGIFVTKVNDRSLIDVTMEKAVEIFQNAHAYASANKPGICPITPRGWNSGSGRDCTTDYDCRGPEKCCPRGHRYRCTMPTENHRPAEPPLPGEDIDPDMGVTPGECPYVPPEGGTRIDRCLRDSECRHGKKCCMGAVGLECMTPIHGGFPPTAGGHVPAVPPPTNNIDPGMAVTPGECPYVPPGGGTRIDRCQRDSDCRYGKKCCMGAYGLECLRPKRRGNGIHRPMPLNN